MVARYSAYAFLIAIGGLVSTSIGADSGQFAVPTLAIERQGDFLTVRIARAPLQLVLSELHRQAGIDSKLLDPADNDTVSETFSDVPLVEAIARLVNGRSFLIDYGPSGVEQTTSHAAPLHVVILPRLNAAPPVASSSRTPMAINELTHAMVDPDENVRARAQEQFEQALTNAPAAATPQPRR